MSEAPSYRLPLRLLQRSECFVVEDSNGLRLAYVYFEDEPSRRAVMKRQTSANAKTVAQTIARALTAAAEGNA